MKPSRDLFDLVQSLSRAEKRYVSLFLSTSLHGSNKNSLRLFRAINKQEAYDETLLKKQLGKSFSERLSAEKNRLFELVMESMLFYYRDTRVEKRIVRLRLQSGFHFQKGLRAQGWKLYRKALAMAEEHESLAQQALLAYQENHEVRLSFTGETKFSLDAYLERNQQLTESLRDDLLLHTLFTAMIDYEKKYGNIPPSQQAQELPEQVMRHPLMDPARKLHALSSQVLRQQVCSIYYAMKKDHGAARDSYNKTVTLMEQSPAYIEQNYGMYCDAIDNQLVQAVLMRSYEGLDQLIPKIRAAIAEFPRFISSDVAYNDLIGVQQYELMIYKNNADTVHGPGFLAQVEKNFARYRPVMRDTLIIGFLYVFGTYHFYLGNLKKALAHYNDLIDSTGLEVGQSFQCMVRLTKLLLHYDLGHSDLLGSLANSTSRLLTRHGRLGPFEKQLIAFFKKSPERNDKKGLRKLYEMICQLAPGHYSYGAWCEFDFEAWAESRLNDLPFHKVVAAGA